MDNEKNIIKVAGILLKKINQLQISTHKVRKHFNRNPNSHIPHTIEFRGVFGMNEVNIELHNVKVEIIARLVEFKYNHSQLKGKYDEVSYKSNVNYDKLQ